jgi:hypothetical protein
VRHAPLDIAARELLMNHSADDDAPIPYMQRTRDYYLALGYDNPYRWAHFDDVPFTALAQPLAASHLALITTAGPFRPDEGGHRYGRSHSAAAKFFEVYSASTDDPPELGIAHLAYDRVHARPDDVNTWFPLAQLRQAVRAGRLGGLTPRFHGVPTNRSQRTTIHTDAPEVLRRCREDGADGALLVPY